MSLQVQFRPLGGWPRLKRTEPGDRRKAQFKSRYDNTLRLLEYELDRIEGSRVVIQAEFRLDQIRQDGWPFARAAPSGPAVILSCETRSGPLSLPCDRYTAYEDNLRAIALSLEALRAVDRYGVTTGTEQYAGFKALPAPGEADMSAGDAINVALLVIWKAAGYVPVLKQPPKSIEQLEEWVRMARRNCHPDAGGSHEAFVAVEQAAEVVREGLFRTAAAKGGNNGE